MSIIVIILLIIMMIMQFTSAFKGVNDNPHTAACLFISAQKRKCKQFFCMLLGQLQQIGHIWALEHFFFGCVVHSSLGDIWSYQWLVLFVSGRSPYLGFTSVTLARQVLKSMLLKQALQSQSGLVCDITFSFFFFFLGHYCF